MLFGNRQNGGINFTRRRRRRENCRRGSISSVSPQRRRSRYTSRVVQEVGLLALDILDPVSIGPRGQDLRRTQLRTLFQFIEDVDQDLQKASGDRLELVAETR